MKNRRRRPRLHLCAGCNCMLPTTMFKVSRNGNMSKHCVDCLVLNSCGRTKSFIYQYLHHRTSNPIHEIENREERLAAVKACAAKVRALVEKSRQKRWEQHDKETNDI